MSKPWKPIEDLPADWASLTDGELGPLLQFWNDQRAELEETGALARFNTRLAREWAIETGQIEGVYDLDRGTTNTLIERGINADLIPRAAGQKAPELIAAIIRDHGDVLDGLFQFLKGERPLSRGYVHELHAALLRHQDTATVVDQLGRVFETALLKGRYKQQPNNPKRSDGNIHRYCPPEHVDAEMDRLIALHAEHEALGVPVEIEAAWLHHRFTQIHPYQDGNGRVARAIATLVFVKSGWFPVVVTRDDRGRYIDALEAADDSNLRPLIDFFTGVQRRDIFGAVKIVSEVEPAATIEQAIAAARRAFASPAMAPPSWFQARDTADRLVGIASERLRDIASALSAGITPEAANFRFYSEGVQSPRLELLSDGSQTIYVESEAIGSGFKGIYSIQVLLTSEGGHRSLVSEEPFQVNYAEPVENAERRFRPWLERSLTRALNFWRQGR
jgi:fido (protein-threonine AMPylation protein)